MEDWVTIRNLNISKGQSIRAISSLMGISRNTVRAALRRTNAPEYKRKEVINEDITLFADFIREAILVKKHRGSRVLEDIRSKGYVGSKSAFYRHLDAVRQSCGGKSFKPYETAPGEQVQFDWSPYTVLIRDELVKVFVHTYILGYSRYRVYWPSLSDNQGAVFEAIEQGIHQTGGSCQRLQTDNARCFVTVASKHGFKWNQKYLTLCGHYGIEPTRSVPRHPWSKGKVENPFDYLEDHFIKDRSYDSFEHLTAKLGEFQEAVNNRVHATTRAKPADLLKIERPNLSDLPANKFVGIEEELRQVSSDCLISYDGSKYSVPHFFVGKQVWVRISMGCYIHIYSSAGRMIAQHTLSLRKGKVIIVDEHYKNHDTERGNWQRLVECFNQTFPLHQAFADNLRVQKRINPRYHLSRILDLTKYYEISLFGSAFDMAIKNNCYSYHLIQALLENDLSGKIQPTINKPSSPHLPDLTDQKISRDLMDYNQLFN
ncbi:MAG: IS21 family transposase [Saprospiraceae bacterium]|nr:IS21 family transposase [Saprospiraceae bacterium]